MSWLVGILVVVVVLGLLWLLSLRGRRGAGRIGELDGWLYAHRGYHRDPDAPENSAKAFSLAVEAGLGAELDVHLLKDGGLAVLHDSSLKRMTGKKGRVEDLCVSDLKKIRLGKSEETIPTLQEILAIFQGKTPLIIELKTVGGNAVPLCETVMEALKEYDGLYCIESFDPKVVWWLRRHRPDIIRGQLSTNFFKDPEKLSLPARFAATNLLANFLTRPDFVAYCHKYRHQPSNRICRSLWKIKGASWTLRSPKALAEAQAEGLWPIFEGFDPATGKKL